MHRRLVRRYDLYLDPSNKIVDLTTGVWLAQTRPPRDVPARCNGGVKTLRKIDYVPASMIDISRSFLTLAHIPMQVLERMAMEFRVNRRAVLGLSGAAAVAATVGTPSPALAAPLKGLAALRATYEAETRKAGGNWHSYVTAISNGSEQVVIDDDPDYVIEGASVQKIAVAVAMLDKVDRGELSLAQKLNLTADIIAGGSGIYHRQAAFGDDLTLANLMVAMLLVSDNTAVRMIGRVVPGPEINKIMAAKGFTRTRVQPLPGNPNRFYLGVTTPREMHTMLQKIAIGTLLSPSSTTALLNVMRWPSVGYNDGVRRVMSSAERGRFAIKYGALVDKRHEVGLLFDEAGAPVLTFCYFADKLPDVNNYGSTNPAVQVHAVLGRTMLEAMSGTKHPSPRVVHPAPKIDLGDEL
jgi:beta-lactamase class A